MEEDEREKSKKYSQLRNMKEIIKRRYGECRTVNKQGREGRKEEVLQWETRDKEKSEK